MRGLLEKDFRLLWKRKNYLLMIGIMAILFSNTMDGYFIAPYICLLCMLLTVSTISYDEFDNGYPFLMVLPITPKTYAVEKYVLAGIMGTISFLLTVVLLVSSTFLQTKSIEVSVLMEKLAIFAPFYMIMFSVMAPVRLKFGNEKSQIVLLLVGGIGMLAALFGKKLLSLYPEGMAGIVQKMQHIPDEAFLWTGVVLLVLLVLSSLRISISIMNHKEY